MSLRIYFILFLLIMSNSILTLGQDYRFSQFHNTPLLLNPAMTGDHKDHYRFNLNYRNQWSSISNAFRSVSGSIDMPAFEDVGGNNKFGIGLSFLSDKAGSTNYGFNNVNLSLAYHLSTTRYSKLSAGLLFGYGQSSADFSSVKWESQYNGNNHDPSLPSGEAVIYDRIIYMDAGTGVLWSAIDPENDRKYSFGLSAMHLNFPNHSFIGQYKNRLKPKLQLHGETEFGYTYFALKPKFLIMNQGPATSFTLGAMIRFRLGNQPDSRFTDAHVGSAFEIGMFYRFDESVFFAIQYEFKRNLMIALSYDVIISDLSVASSAGGYEIALRYQGLFENNKIKVKKDMNDEKQDNNQKKKKQKTNMRM